MPRHYGLNIGDKVIYDNEFFIVKEFDFFDNNRCYLQKPENELIHVKEELVPAVCEWCKVVNTQ